MKKSLLVIVSMMALVGAGATPLAASGQAPLNGGQTAASGDSGWPRKMVSGNMTVLFYRPQIDKWEGNQVEGYAAISVETGSDRPTYGEFFFMARATVDTASRQVTMDNFKVTRGSFPSAPDRAAGYQSIIQQYESGRTWTAPQDQLLSDLAVAQAEHKTAYELKNDPPRIIFSTTPAVLVIIDGEPVLRPAGDGELQRVINTRALMLFDQKSGAYYLGLMDGWVQAPSSEGPWTFAESVPSAADQVKTQLAARGQIDLLNGDQTGPSDRAVPDRSAPATHAATADTQVEPLGDRLKDGTFPTVYVSTVPAELVTAQGDPQFKPIPNTSLLYVTNSGDQIFMNTADQDYYLLISGRWFTARSMDGRWRYVDGKELPADFAKIPEGDPKASVLASTRGTPAAQEAAIENRIPQTATVDRRQASLTVNYDGSPRFETIPGTHLKYAVNSATPVIEVRPGSFRAVQDGVWFAGSSAVGPWEVATSVPPEVYSIPASSPIHNVIYVRIYGFTPDVVYEGYTPGYYGTVLTPDGLVVYGTGWYYPPYIGSNWIGWPWTYGLGAGFGWSPWSGWGFGFGSGFLFPFYRPWWGPFGFGWGFPRWGFAWGGGWGWRPGFGWSRGFGWGPGFGWGGLRAFNFYERWGRSAFIGRPVGWAGGRFAQPGLGSGFGRLRPGAGNVRGFTGNSRVAVPNSGFSNSRSGRFANRQNGVAGSPGNRAFGNSGNVANSGSRSRSFSAPRSGGYSGRMGGGNGGRVGAGYGGRMGGGSGGRGGGRHR